MEAATARARSSVVRPEPAASRESMRSPASRAASRTQDAHSACAARIGSRAGSRSATTTEALPETSTHGACGSTTVTRTSGRARRAWMGRDSVGRPVTTTVSTSRPSDEATSDCSKGVTPPSAHAPEAGSARSGKPDASDHSRARGDAPSPATISPAAAGPTTSSQRVLTGDTGSTRAGRGTKEAPASSPEAEADAGEAGVSGSRKATLIWTGPGVPVGAPHAAATQRVRCPTSVVEAS